MKNFCAALGPVCDDISYFFNLDNSQYVDPNRAAVVKARPASSASTKQVVHYGEICQSGVYR